MIVLVNPPLTKQEIYGALAEGGIYMPPLGLASLAAFMREQGHRVKIVDASALGFSPEETVDHVLHCKPKCVGITSTSLSIKKSGQLARLFKEKVPDLKLVIGGSHVTALPRETMEGFPYFDIGVIGEGELAFLNVIRCLEAQRPLSDIKGIIFRQDGILNLNSEAEFINNLDTLPFPAWDLLPDLAKNYKPSCFGFNRLPSTTMLTARGCPRRCTFCSGTAFSRNFRAHSPEYVIEMIQFLQAKYGVKDIFFQDGDFAFDKGRVLKLCRLMKQEKLNLTWSCDCRADSVDAQILREMKGAGCWAIEYGIESGSQRILDFIKKDLTIRGISKALELTKKEGILTRGNLMIGHLIETEETLRQTLDFALNNNLDMIKVTYFTPFPGSLDYFRAPEYGMVKDDYNVFNCYNVSFVPKGLTEETLTSFSRYIARKFFLRLPIIIRYAGMCMDIRKSGLILRGFLSFMKFSTYNKGYSGMKDDFNFGFSKRHIMV